MLWKHMITEVVGMAALQEFDKTDGFFTAFGDLYFDLFLHISSEEGCKGWF